MPDLRRFKIDRTDVNEVIDAKYCHLREYRYDDSQKCVRWFCVLKPHACQCHRDCFLPKEEE